MKCELSASDVWQYDVVPQLLLALLKSSYACAINQNKEQWSVKRSLILRRGVFLSTLVWRSHYFSTSLKIFVTLYTLCIFHDKPSVQSTSKRISSCTMQWVSERMVPRIKFTTRVKVWYHTKTLKLHGILLYGVMRKFLTGYSFRKLNV